MSKIKKGSPTHQEGQMESIIGQCPDNKMEALIVGLNQLADQQQQQNQASQNEPNSDSISKDTSESQ